MLETGSSAPEHSETFYKVAKFHNSDYLLTVRFLNPIFWPVFSLSLYFSLSLILTSSATTWAQAQKSRDYLAARKHLADYLPELAIPKIKSLLALPELDQKAQRSLLTLLGEAQIRSALETTPAERSKVLGEALKTLDAPVLREHSPAHLWRSYALSNLGRLRDAIGELKKIDRPSMQEEAQLQMSSLQIAIRDLKNAKASLRALLKSNKPQLAQRAKLMLISIALSEKKADEVERLLKTLQSKNLHEEILTKYLNGRLQLLRAERLNASGTFQNLIDRPESSQSVSSALFHEASLALADSLALGGNEQSGITSLLQTLEKHPDSPRLQEIFTRLKLWSPKIETAPLLAKLSTWVPLNEAEPTPKFRAIREGDSAAGFAETTNQEILSPRALHALEFIASIKLKSPDPAVRATGMKQLEQLQFVGRIDSPLVNRSLLDLGMAHLENNEYQRAITLFNLLSESKRSPLLRAYARALSGKASFANQQPEEASQSFLEARNIAQRLRESSLRANSELNAGISLLATTNSKNLDALTQNLTNPEAKSFLILERGLYLNTINDPAARDLLASFIADFPNSPRRDEALLSLAESSTHAQPADPVLSEFIKSELPSLSFDFETQPRLEARRILALLAIGLGQDQASDFITKSPDHPYSPRLLFQLGQTQRKIEPIGKAYATFEKFLTDYPESEFAEAARYLSALTSAASGVESGQVNAILRFRELIAGKGALAHEAAISLTSLLIDRAQPELALVEIAEHLKSETFSDSDRRRLLILGADASGQLGKHEEVLTFYTQLLEIPNLPDSTLNRASFQMGLAYEKLERKAEALECYLSVVNRDFDPKKTTSLEWKWFDKCGLEGALALLEREKRWRAAINLAEKLGKSGSPRAKDAQESALRISLEQRIPRDQ